MKKVFTTALVLSLSMAVLTSPVLADNQEKEQIQKNVLVEKIQAPEEKTMEATIKEIQDHNWIVADQDGKEYTVPILGFEQLEDYKKLDLTVGTKVTLKGNSINPADGPVKFFRTVSGDANILKTAVGEEGAFDSVAVKKLFDGKGMDIKNFNREDVMISKVEGKNQRIFTLNDNDLKSAESENIPLANRKIIIKALENEGKIKVYGKDMAEELKGDLFMAREMAVDGMTLKLPMMKIAMPALPATEEISE